VLLFAHEGQKVYEVRQDVVGRGDTSEHQFITDEYCDFYFANPYSPWERGSNENLNGLIRQYIPKSSDFSLLSEERILEIQNRLNHRPRKRFNFENPIFVMEKLLFNPEVALVA
jgi:transposase, IS30 family